MEMSDNPNCLVLMCTYNGAKYLREQIDSILEQTGVDIFLKVADDCSTDATIEILKEYDSKYANFNFYVNDKNKHFTYNFIDLLFSTKEDKFDYYAFSDQDDYWKPTKIISAINKIKEKNNTKIKENGVLYFSNQNVVDCDLNLIGLKYPVSPSFVNKYAYLCENIATGCTFVFDCKFKDYVCSYYPKNIYFHDHYLFLVSLFAADYIYDQHGHIDYRQHGDNVIGASRKKKTLTTYLKRLITKKQNSQAILARELLFGYEKDIESTDYKMIKLASFGNKNIFLRSKLFLSRKVQPINDKLIFKIQVLFKKF